MQIIWEEAFTVSHAICLDVFSCSSHWLDKKSLKSCARVPSTSRQYWNGIRNSGFHLKKRNKLQVPMSGKNSLSTWFRYNHHLIAGNLAPSWKGNTNFKVHAFGGRRANSASYKALQTLVPCKAVLHKEIKTKPSSSDPSGLSHRNRKSLTTICWLYDGGAISWDLRNLGEDRLDNRVSGLGFISLIHLPKQTTVWWHFYGETLTRTMINLVAEERLDRYTLGFKLRRGEGSDNCL